MIKYIVYKTTCTINGKFYIGQHQTHDENDSYLGSGLLLQSAIRKYGKENFVKEILHVYDCKEDMNAKEAELVTEEMLKNPLCYNLAPGGQGGNLGEAASLKIKNAWTDERRALASERMIMLMNDDKWKHKIDNSRRRHRSAEERLKIANSLKGQTQSEETKKKRADSNRGKKRSEETRERMRNGAKNRPKPSEEAKQKMSESAKNREKKAWTGKKRPTKQCPHCGKIGADFLMTRWHFDKCKSAT
jgi:hypothetical protein